MFDDKNTPIQPSPFELRQKTKEYLDAVRYSYYNYNTAPKVKKYKREYDDEGRPLKVNLETGEVRSYTFKEFQESDKSSIDRTIDMFRDIVRMNDFDWFVTLTFDPSIVNREDIDEVTRLYKTWVDRIRRKSSAFGYISVPEPHHEEVIVLDDGEELTIKGKCFHYHMLINGATWRDLGFIDSGFKSCSWANFSKKKIMRADMFEKTKSKYISPIDGSYPQITDGLTIYNVTSFKYGWATATKVASKERCGWYVRKYMDKAFGSTDVFKKRFYYSSNLKLPVEMTKVIKINDKPADVKELVNNNELFKFADYINYFEAHDVASLEIKKSAINNFIDAKHEQAIMQALDVNDDELPF